METTKCNDVIATASWQQEYLYGEVAGCTDSEVQSRQIDDITFNKCTCYVTQQTEQKKFYTQIDVKIA